MATYLLKPRKATINWDHPLCRSLATDSLISEGSGTKTLDIAGLLSASITGATWSKDLLGTCLSFAGVSTTDYVELKTGTILSGLVNSTVTAWINPNQQPIQGTTGAWTIYVERPAVGNDILKLEMAKADGQGSPAPSNGTLRFVFRDDAGTLNYGTTGSTVVPINSWHHVAVVKLGTAVTLYIDGFSKGSTTLTATNTFTDSNIKCRIAGDIADTTSNFPGKISNLRLFKRALNAQEILFLYAHPWDIYYRNNFQQTGLLA